MKVTTVDKIFKIGLYSVIAFAVILFIAALYYSVVKGEADPLRGSLRGLFTNWQTLVVLVGIAFAFGTGMLVFGKVKAE